MYDKFLNAQGVKTLYGRVLKYVNENAGAGGGMTAKTYNATLLASDWTGDAAPYSQTVTITGITENNISIVELVQTRNETTDAELRKNISLVTSIVPATNSITAYASKVPEVDLPIQIVAFKKGSASGDSSDDSSDNSSNITVDQTVVADSENPVSGAAVANYAFPKDQIVPTTVDPGEGAVVDYPDGTVILVHE